MGQIILTFDALIIRLFQLFYITLEKVLYTLVVVFIASKLIDFIQDSTYSAKAFSIISDHSAEIAAAITNELERGVTLMARTFSGQDKEVVYCVVGRYETRGLKGIVRKIDPRAFIVINHVHDVLGEGFRGGMNGHPSFLVVSFILDTTNTAAASLERRLRQTDFVCIFSSPSMSGWQQ